MEIIFQKGKNTLKIQELMREKVYTKRKEESTVEREREREREREKKIDGNDEAEESKENNW